MINLLVNFTLDTRRWTSFLFVEKFELYIDFNLMLNGHAVRISEILDNPHIRECLFLLTENVGGGITPDEVLENIFKTFFWRKCDETFIKEGIAS